VMSKNLESLNISGISQNRINPTIAILIGASSAVGFIVVETLGQYVPDIDDTGALAYGLMLLIPRFITGMAGHVGWAGIVAYYFALGFYYKKVNLFFPLIGWVFASILHALWNSTVSYSPVIGAMVALSTFMIFIVYLFKSKISFPVDDRF
jgi:RsiW-degrading membrane proteinase PrsW (M82 family)